jgi:hypothetical protein
MEFALPRPDWSRPLSTPLTIPGILNLTTLADVRILIRRLPAEWREKERWRHVAACLEAAARGADTVEVAVALRLVLAMEGVECRTK